MRQHRVDEIANKLPKRAWKRLSAGPGAKGERLYDWALVCWAEHEGWLHTLLVRRSLDAKPEYAFYFTYGTACRGEKNLPQEGSSQRSRNPASARPVAVARLAKSGTSPALV